MIASCSAWLYEEAAEEALEACDVEIRSSVRPQAPASHASTRWGIEENPDDRP